MATIPVYITSPKNALEPLPDFVGGDLYAAAHVAFIIMGVVMVFSGVIGNCLLLLVILKQFKRHQSVHILFVANLSLADLATMGYWFTFFVLDLILNRHPVVNYAHCVFNSGVFAAAMYSVCISFLVSISLNRYMHVCHSHLYSRVFTLPRTVAWCLLTWLVSFFLALLPFMDNAESTHYHYNPVTRFCSYNRQGFNNHKVFALAYAILPMLFVAYFNFAIFRYWRRARLRTSRRYPLVQREEGKRQKLVARLRSSVKRDKAVCTTTRTITQRNDEHVEPTTSEVSRPAAKVTIEIVNNRDLNHEEGKSIESVESQCQNSKEAECIVSNTDPDAIVHVADGKVRAADEEASNHSLSSGSVYASFEDLVNGCEENQESEDNEAVASPRRQPDDVANQSSEVADDIENTSQQPSKCPEGAKKGATPSSVPKSPTPTIHVISGSPPMRRKRTPANQADKIPRTAKQDAKKQATRTKSREVAFVRSLFIVFLLAVVTFIPYGAMTVLATYVRLSPEVIILGNFFLFFNNSVNWIVYGVMNPAFRQDYVQYSRKIRTACCSWRKAHVQVMQLNVSLCSLVRPTVQGSNVTTTTSHSPP